MTRTVCVYGGSFDPPHVCHVLASAWALSVLAIDEVWWVPVFGHAFDKQLTPFETRFAMCQAALSALPGRARVDDIERRLGGTSRTWHTLEALEADHPQTSFSLLIGADLVEQMPRWYRGQELSRRLPVHVVGRSGYEAEQAAPIELPDVSSSGLRAALAEGRVADVKGWLPRSVYDMVTSLSLYGPRPE